MVSNNLENVTVVTSGPEYSEGEEGTSPIGLLNQVHSLLRGRYWIAVILGLMGVAAGGYLGWHLQEPTYQSTGLIQVKPNLPRILYQSDQNGVMPMFDSFVESQVALITSQRVIDFAMQHPEWKALGRGLSQESVLEFTENVKASHPRGSELVLVSFTDKDPEAARRGVTALIKAYEQVYGESDSNSVQARIKVLEELRRKYDEEHRTYTEKARAISNEVSTTDVDQLYASRREQLEMIGTRLREAELAVALSLGSAGKGPTTAPVEGTLPLEVLATRVPQLQGLITSKRELERMLAVDRGRFGEQHRNVRDQEAALASLSEQIEEIASVYQGLQDSGADAATDRNGKTLAELQADVVNVRELYERVKTETESLGRKCVEVQALKADADAMKSKLNETTQRIDQLNIESSVGGRISIESHGDRPLAPAKDKRKQFAAVGGLGLGGLGVGIVVLVGLLDRRVRHISDVQVSNRRSSRVLGVLPVLADVSDPEQAMLAAHGVHQIRTLLQGQTGEHPVIAITSPSPGAGKTSLTLALGLSFAASGARTLLIDCDIVGGGLTSKIKTVTRRRVEHILRRLGRVTTEQVVSACRESRKRNEPVHEALLRMGVVSRRDVDQALQTQQDSVVGLREALQGEPWHECVTRAGTDGMFLMPLGSARREHVAQLSYPGLRRLLDDVRKVFDVVLIDTGPVLGSLEASVVAMAADRVVLTVPRGERRPLIERAIEQLTDAGGKLAGIVLNRADVTDMFMSGFSSSVSRSSGEEAPKPMELIPVDHKHLRLGPIGTAVVAVTGSSV